MISIISIIPIIRWRLSQQLARPRIRAPSARGSICFYFPCGLAVATNTRVSNELGAGRWASARFASNVSLLLGLGLVCCTWLGCGYQVWDGGLEAVEVEKIEILEMLPGNLQETRMWTQSRF